MRNLIAFFRRFRIFLVFIILQIIALTSYFSVVQYPRTRFFNSSSSMVASSLDIQHDLTKHFGLEEDNLKLQAEIVELQSKQLKNYIALSDDKISIADTLLELQYDYIPAVVVNATYNHRNNFFTLNKGLSSGIKRDMGVISPDGLVGIVYDVSNHYALVKSLLTANINIPANVKGVNANGLLKWEDDKYDPRFINLTGVSNDIPIEIGAKVVTNSQSGIFPKDHELGEVAEISEIEGKPEWNIKVYLSNDLRTLQSVFVVQNILKLEKDSLEQVFKDDYDLSK